jgi:hypothetical protein
MGRATRVVGAWLGGMLVVWLVAAIMPGELFGGEVAQPSPGPSVTPADAVLTVHDGVLSLLAQDASPSGFGPRPAT